MTPSREAIEDAATALIEADGETRASFNNLLWPKYLLMAEAALTPAYARDFPQPSKSDEERARAWLTELQIRGKYLKGRFDGTLRMIDAALKRKGERDAK